MEMAMTMAAREEDNNRGPTLTTHYSGIAEHPRLHTQTCIVQMNPANKKTPVAVLGGVWH
eukprot:7153609-Alexandrium_andersonii.AAC.1